jgi:hypothetical protein
MKPEEWNERKERLRKAERSAPTLSAITRCGLCPRERRRTALSSRLCLVQARQHIEVGGPSIRRGLLAFVEVLLFRRAPIHRVAGGRCERAGFRSRPKTGKPVALHSLLTCLMFFSGRAFLGFVAKRVLLAKQQVVLQQPVVLYHGALFIWKRIRMPHGSVGSPHIFS